jgi:hypothetical protein
MHRRIAGEILNLRSDWMFEIHEIIGEGARSSTNAVDNLATGRLKPIADDVRPVAPTVVP